MDNLTHTLTGVMIARAGLNRVVPRGTLLLAIAANMPDVDVASWLGGTLTYLRYHRWLTHGLTLAPALALVPAVLICLLERRWTSFRKIYLVALLGVLSHSFLDWTNVYGVRMLLPWSSEWLRLDTVNVVDIWIWAILLLGIAAPALSRLVSSEIGARRPTGRGWAIATLLLLGAYEFGRSLAHDRVIAVLESRIYAGGLPRRVAAFPGPGNPARWTGLVETESAFLLYDYDLLMPFDPASGRQFYKPENSPAMEAARQTDTFRVFLDFSKFTLWRVVPAPDGSAMVAAYDLRFGDPSRPGFVATARLGPGGRVEEEQFSFAGAPVRQPK